MHARVQPIYNLNKINLEISRFFICLEKSLFHFYRKMFNYLAEECGYQCPESCPLGTLHTVNSLHTRARARAHTESMVRHITLRRFSYGKYWPPRARARTPITRRIMYSFPRHCKCWFSVSRLHRRRGLLIWCGQI